MLEIKSIKKVPFKGSVYNLAVENDETYIAEGTVVHNCRSLLIAILVGESDNPDSEFSGYKENEETWGTGVSHNFRLPAEGFGGISRAEGGWG